MAFTDEDIFINQEFLNDLNSSNEIYCFNCVPLNYGFDSTETFSNITTKLGTTIDKIITATDEVKAIFPSCIVNKDCIAIPFESSTIHDYYSLAFLYYYSQPTANTLGNNYRLAFIIHIKDIYGHTEVTDLFSFTYNYIYFDLKTFQLKASLFPVLNNPKYNHNHLYTTNKTDTTKVFDAFNASYLNTGNYSTYSGILLYSDIQNQYCTQNALLKQDGTITSSRYSSISTNFIDYGVFRYFENTHVGNIYSLTPQIDTLELEGETIDIHGITEVNATNTVLINSLSSEIDNFTLIPAN